MSDDSWLEHKGVIFTELQRLRQDLEKLYNEVKDSHGNLVKTQNKINVSIAKLQVKTGFWGFAAGLIGGLIWYLRKG